MTVFSPEVRADPSEVYRRLREAGPLHDYVPGIHLVPRYADCDAVFGDPAWGHGYFSGINPFRPGVDPARLPGSFLLMDPPDHTRLRSLVTKAFTQRAVAALVPRVTEIVDGLLDNAIERGEVDFVADIAYLLPLTTICELLGVPAADHEVFGRWASAISRGLDPDALLTEAEKAARAEAVVAFAEYFAALVAERERHPGPDLLSKLVAVAEGGDRLSVKEICDIGVLLLIAGHETTMNLIASGVLALGRAPEQRAILRADPGLSAPAVEEFLRFDTPVPFPTRVAMRDVEFAGRELPRGTGLILLAGSANRDPEVFPDPDRLDVLRFDPARGGRKHLAFSHGPHFCLGAPLARLEATVLFERLMRRAPDYELLDSAPPYRDTVSMRGPRSLPVRFR
ncbi:cytochrome P450 [Actinokineospora sp. NBRC 105648]|uniref:cytochrome P450 n=1 Tax=Actinokineospora sp. NBRC 105648 TaxID=3032206 RepID=UPI002556FCD5|nr:cytochrome P450 [Actinokineospora sp. NBRC 105648]